MQNSRVSSKLTVRDESMARLVGQLGSAHEGSGEWRIQRLTALALIPLGLYLVASLLRLAPYDRITATKWLGSPAPALLMIFLTLAALTHAAVGLRSIILDYIHTPSRLFVTSLLLRSFAVILAGASVLAVLKIFLGR
jgi:succinate dehydrogenase / fumarate reductase membrane anchor subunit